MKNFIVTIFATVLANTAFASWIAPVQTLSCTRDFNAWGQSGNCECPNATRYERSLGQCVQGAPVEISVEGVIKSEPTLNGDSNAIVLTNENSENYELVTTRMIRAHIEELEAQGLNFRITGEVLEIYDASKSEAVSRPVIIVKDIEELATFRNNSVQQKSL